MEPLYREFGRLVRARREALELTQDEVAERIGMGRTSITNIEKGRQHVSLHLLYEISRVLGIAPAELLPDRSTLLSTDADLERTLQASTSSLPAETKDWIRRVVLNTSREGKDHGQ